MIAPPDTLVCTPAQHAEIMRHVRLGRLFELMDWVADGLPTMIPATERPRTKDSPIREAITCGNHSMVRFLWERCWQWEWEAESLVASALWEGTTAANAIAKYFLAQGLPIRDALAYDVFKSHDDELIDLALKRGVSVRGPDGFADALSATGHSKHLLGLFRKLRGEYPELEMEGLIALKEAVEKGKVRAAALLTWAGVEPLAQFPDDPYDTEDDDPYLITVLESVRLDDKTREMLKALKIEITPEIWFKFLDTAGWLKPEKLAEVWHWRADPEETMRAHPGLAAELTTSILRHLDGWGREYEMPGRQAVQLKACEYFAHLGVPFLITKEEHETRSLRRSFAKTKDTRALARLFWVIHERGDEEQRARLREIVRTPKMKAIIRQHDSFLLRDLGLAPKRMASIKITKRDRPWHIEDCKTTCPFEKPVKEKKSELIPHRPLPYYPPPDPAPRRFGYWNKLSHFHR